MKIAGGPHPKIKVFVRKFLIVTAKRIQHFLTHHHGWATDKIGSEHIPKNISDRNMAKQFIVKQMIIMIFKRLAIGININGIGKNHTRFIILSEKKIYLLFNPIRKHDIIGGEINYKLAGCKLPTLIESLAVAQVFLQ